MTIRINQIAVEFSLEKERTLADLTAALRSWATAQNLAVLGILADGRAVGPEDTTSLDEVQDIDVEAVPAGERDLARVAVVSRFFSLLAQGWDRGDRSLVAELHQEYASVRGALFPLLAPLAARLTGALETLDGPWTDQRALAEASRTVAAEAEKLRKELQDPGTALAETVEAIEASVSALGTLATLFQQGQDRDGFDRILAVFTLMEDLGRRADLLFRQTGDEPDSWAEFHTDLNPWMKELEGALAARDFILLTDLLEYEVGPRLLAVRSAFPEMAKLDRVPDLL